MDNRRHYLCDNHIHSRFHTILRPRPRHPLIHPQIHQPEKIRKMAAETRTQKSILNAKVSSLCYFLGLAVSFFTRKIFIEYLGLEFVGLTSTLQSLLGFLNLAELGISSAIAFVLYKPLFEKDHDKIGEIVSVLGYLYRCIGIFILSSGIILSFFIPLIFDETSFSLGVIYIGYYAFLLSSLYAYFFNYKLNLLSADQKNYVVIGYFKIVVASKCVIQMLLAIYFKSFILFFAMELLSGLVNAIILNRKIKRTYPWLNSNVKFGRKLFAKYPEIGKNIKWLFVHKLGSFIQFQITPFLIFTFASLPVVGLYGNYTLINDNIRTFVGGVLDSTAAGIGNLISENNQEKILRSYKELFSVRFLSAGILASCLYMLISPFVSVWLGVGFVLSDVVVILLCIQFFLVILRGTTDQFINGYGLFYDIWAPISEAGLLVVISVIFGSIYGLPGVLFGPIVASIIFVHIWKPYFLFSKGFKIPIWRYIKLFSSNLITFALAFIFAMIGYNSIGRYIAIENDWIQWIVNAVIFTIVISIITLILFYTFVPGIKSFAHRFFCKNKA